MNFRRQRAALVPSSAFTMIELLVVVAVVGILAALILPALGKSLENAQAAQSTNNLRQLLCANMAYAADNGVFCPAVNKKDTMYWCAKKVGATWDPTQGYLSDYLGKSRRVTVCPLFKEMIKDSRSFDLGCGGYGYNSSYVGGRPGGGCNADGSSISAQITQISRSNTVMFTTSALAKGDGVQEYPKCEPPYWDFGDGPTESPESRPSPSVHFRFNNKALVGWCDGRVTAESCDPREVGFNPYGGDATTQKLGWFGPDENNGYWNPCR